MPFSSKVEVLETAFSAKHSRLTLSHRYFPNTEVIRTVDLRPDRLEILDRIHTSLDLVPHSSLLLAPGLEPMSGGDSFLAFCRKGQPWRLIICAAGGSRVDRIVAAYSPSYDVETRSIGLILRPTTSVGSGDYEISFSLHFVRMGEKRK